MRRHPKLILPHKKTLPERLSYRPTCILQHSHDTAQVTAASRDPEARERARLELADVLVYCLCLSNALEIDVSQAVQDKLAIAGHKYPPEAYRGRARKPGQIQE